MSGGKETPRQKMIGMMYLVLTALLALNVSKSILDAFVAIEENTQKSNIAQHDRGSGFKLDVSGEKKTTPNNAENKAKLQKLNAILSQMDAVDKETAKMIVQIDLLKIEIMKKSGEAVEIYKDQDEKTILWKKYDKNIPCLPARMHLMAVQSKDQYDVPMHVIIGDDIKTPTGEGKKLWEDFNNYRLKLVDIVGTYKLGENSFKVKSSGINAYTSNDDLVKQVEKMINGTKGNLKEDGQVLMDIYINLTKLEKNKVHDVSDVHWMGATFDHSPLVAALASLSSMQQDILSSRALAMAHLKSKVTTGEYSFNKIMPLAYGPEIANSGDEIDLQIMMAAFDSDNQPKVTSNSGGVVTYAGDGQGRLKIKVSGSNEVVLTGTVAIKNKSGVEKKENWTKTIKIMKPMGTVALPEMRVLYRGYQNVVEAVASGYDQTNISGGGVTLVKSGATWIGTPGAGKTCTITVSGKNSLTNKSVNLGTFTFDVKGMPKAEIFWGQNADGDKVSSRTATTLYARFGDGIPLTKAKFNITSWAMSIPGAPKTVFGQGTTLNQEAMRFLKAAPAGSVVSFSCVYSGTGVKNKTSTSGFKL